MAICVMPKPEGFEKLSEEELDYLNSEEITLRHKIFDLADMFQLTDKDRLQRKTIAEEIMNFLRPFYPYCNVLIFGSSVNGFGFRGCDLDLLFLPFPEYCNLDFHGQGIDVIPSVRQILQGKVPKERLISMEENQHLKFIQRVMLCKRSYFSRIVYIPARCPILNLSFIDYPISCDITVSNQLVTSNTELLWLFGELDHRVKPLVIILRYWAKSLGFISKSCLSSYAFTLMAVFFLQNIVPPILPSIQYLSEIAGYNRIIDGWESAICVDPSCYVKSENVTPIDELMVQFFEFYINFDFDQNVVSPYYGRPLLITELKESNDERIKQFRVNAFNIQDAFILSRNVSRNSSIKTAFKFASQIAKNLILKENFVFPLLFNSSFYQKKVDKRCLPGSDMREFFPNSTFFKLCLDSELRSKLGITSQLSPWYKKASQAVLDVLQYGLLIECEVLDKVIWTEDLPKEPFRERKLNAGTTDLELIMSIQCKFYFWTIQSRQKVQELDLINDADADELPQSLRKEFVISKWLFINGDLSLPVVWFTCQIYKYSIPSISDIIVIFTPLNDEGIFKHRKCHLKNFVQKQVNKFLREDMSLVV